MLERSVARDYDIQYHTRSIQRCLEDIREHAEALTDVDFNPYFILEKAVKECQNLTEELGVTLY